MTRKLIDPAAIAARAQRRKEYQKQYYQAHKATLKSYAKEYRSTTNGKAIINASIKKYRLTDKYRAVARRHQATFRARMKAANPAAWATTQAAYNRRNRGNQKKWRDRSRIENRERWLVKEQENYYRNRARWRDAVCARTRLRKYGITSDSYDGLLASQGGVCAICECSDGRRNLAVDHCHETGVIRGLLCRSCNLMLGFACDDPEALSTAIAYLGRLQVDSKT